MLIICFYEIFFYKKVTEDEKNELKKSIIVKVGEVDRKTVRLLTHLDVDSDQIDLAIEKIRYVANEYAKLD
jgi:threonine aldolase